MNNRQVLRVLNDVNGDGFNDVVVGDPQLFFSYPTVVFPQRDLERGDTVQQEELNQSSLSFSWVNGVNKPGNRGNVLGAGDINGDGFNDLIYQTNYSYTSSNSYQTFFATTVQVVYGDEEFGRRPQNLDVDNIFGNTGFTAGTDFDDVQARYFGSADIDGDGFDDVLIARPGDVNNRGAISITFGTDETVFDDDDLSISRIENRRTPSTSWQVNEYFGDFISQSDILGDINQDGRADFKYDDASNAGSLIILGGERSRLNGSIEQLINRGLAGFDGVNQYPNIIIGDSDENTLRGLGGNDFIQGLDGNDKLSGDKGSDRLLGGRGADQITGGNGHDLIYGEQANDVLLGNRGHDVLFGGNGQDWISGGPGRDRIVGGRGRDYLKGGAHRDDFVFQSIQHLEDRIMDFDPNEDRISLSQVGFDRSLALGSLSASRFTIGSTAQDKNDRVIYDDQAGVLLFDSDGSRSGQAVIIAIVGSNLAISAQNIRII